MILAQEPALRPALWLHRSATRPQPILGPHMRCPNPAVPNARAIIPEEAPMSPEAHSLAMVAAHRARHPLVLIKPRWTILLAFYNEAGCIEATLRQLLTQTRTFRLVLVDNGSTDASVACCEAALADAQVDYVILTEAQVQGQTAAFERGLAQVDTEFVATCDADTFYPYDYLQQAERLFDRDERVVVASAYFLEQDWHLYRAFASALHQVGAFHLLPKQWHVGAAGHAFRTARLKAAGGYSYRLWPFLMGDHEIIHRVLQHGRQSMSMQHWCCPSPRRGAPLRWSLLERILYHLTPFPLKGRYFRWLAVRFERSGMWASRLRTRDWIEAGQ